jgi:hypothetical protein
MIGYYQNVHCLNKNFQNRRIIRIGVDFENKTYKGEFI